VLADLEAGAPMNGNGEHERSAARRHEGARR
jgi:hypothetical protein